MLRDCLDGTKAIMQIYLDSDCVVGHSDYNYSSIDKFAICCAPHVAHYVYDIPIGQKYFVFPKTLSVCITGDGGRMTRVPRITGTIPFVFVRVLALLEGAQHSKYSGICCLGSKLSSTDVRIEEYVAIILRDIGKEGTFVLKSKKTGIYCIYKYKCTMNGDWDWLFRIVNRCTNPTSKYPFCNMIRWKDGVPKMIENKIFSKYHALFFDVTSNDDNKSVAQLVDEKFTGYRLATDEVCQYLVNLVENDYNDMYNDTDLNGDQERDVRRKIAYRYSHGFLYPSEYNNNDAIFDVCHCWWSILIRILTVLLSCTWCFWHWSRKDVIDVYDLLGVDWITNQTTDWINVTNPHRNEDKSITWFSNGDINKTIIDALPDALAAAVKIACDRGDDTEIGICCLFVRYSSLMRNAFGVLLTDNFQLKPDGSLPDKIVEMMDNVNLAVYLSYHLFDHLVCLIFCTFGCLFV